MRKYKRYAIVLAVILLLQSILYHDGIVGIAFANPDEGIVAATEEGEGGSLGEAVPPTESITPPDDEPTTPPSTDDGSTSTTPPSVDDGSGTTTPPSTDDGSTSATPPSADDGTTTPDTSVGANTTPGTNRAPGVNNDVTTVSPEITQQEMDTRLSGLTINCGELIPAFSSDVYEYTVYVTKDQGNKNCGTTATSVDPAASISAEGPLEFTDKDITKKITVTGGNGEKSEYVINVHIIKETELLVDNKLYQQSKKPALKLLPDGFKKVNHNLGDEKLTLARSSGGTLLVAQFINEDDDEDYVWCIFDEEAAVFSITQVLEIDGKKYIVVSAEENMVYGIGKEGMGYYRYNEAEGTLELIEIEPEEQTEDKNFFGSTIFIILAIALAGIAAGSAGYLYFKKKKTSQKEEKSVGSRYFNPYISLKDEDEEDGTNAE